MADPTLLQAREVLRRSFGYDAFRAGQERAVSAVLERRDTLVILPTMHVAWGLGFLAGVLRGAHDTVDTSRLGDRNTPLP